MPRPFLPALAMLLVTSTLLAMSSPAQAQHTQKSQKSLYSVSWHDASVARVSLHQGCASSTHTPVALVASSTGLADDLHSFSIRLDSFLALTTDLLPKQGRTRITEEDRTRAYTSSFSKTSVHVDADIFGKKKEDTHTLPQPSHDLLSWVFAAGAQLADPDFDRATYTVWDGWKLVKLEITRQPSASIKTPLTTFENAHVVSVMRTRLDLDGKPQGDPSKLGTLWFSDSDSPRLVAMDFESRVGLATIRLVKHSTKACKAK